MFDVCSSLHTYMQCGFFSWPFYHQTMYSWLHFFLVINWILTNNNREKKELVHMLKNIMLLFLCLWILVIFAAYVSWALCATFFLYCFTSYRLIILKVTTWLKNIAKEQILHLKLLIYIINYKSYIFLYVDYVIQ